jgi:hypothetical protein
MHLLAAVVLIALVATGLASRGGGSARPFAAASGPARSPDGLGPGASLQGRAVFRPDSPWNTEIAHVPADPNSDQYLRSIGIDAPLHPDFGTTYRGAPNGIPYVLVAGTQPRVPVSFEYADESDHDLYPIPDDPPIEGGRDADGDRHVLIVDRDNWRLFELLGARREKGLWKAESGAIFDLAGDTRRPAGWTSADAAGLPIFPGLVRHDEVVERGEIRHALRFTAPRTRRAYVHPASHWASRETDPSLPPMGLRVRLRAGFDVTGFPPTARVVLTALKRYGMILADNGGSWFLSGAPDPRWNDAEIDTLKRVKGRDFEVVHAANVVAPD